MKRFIFDIDGTILLAAKHHDYEASGPIPRRIARVNALYTRGHTIIYWTSRGEDCYNFTKEQLDSFGCLYHELWCGKPQYDVWVDDKAFTAYEYFR